MRGKPMPVIFLTVFLDLLGFGIVIPLLPFIAQSTGASAFQVTLLMASYSLMQFLMAPVWGRLSDRIGRRPVLLMSIGGSIAALLLFAFSTTFIMLLVARLAHGAMNANIAVAQAAIADITTPETRAKGMGMFGAAFGLGFVFGPAIGGLLGHEGLQLAALAAAALATINLASAFALLPETRQLSTPNRAGSRPWRIVDVDVWRGPRRARLRAILWTMFLVTLGFSAMESIFSLWTQRTYGWAALQNGLLFAYIGIVIVIVQGGLIGPLRRRYTERSIAIVGAVGLAAGLLMLPFASTLAVLVIVTSVLAFANAVLQPNLSALASHEGEAERGRVMGAYQSAGAIARVLGPMMAGALFTIASAGVPFVAGGLIIAAGALVLAGDRNAAPVRPTPGASPELDRKGSDHLGAARLHQGEGAYVELADQTALSK